MCYSGGMRRCIALLILLLSATPSAGQTLGQALDEVRAGSQALLSSQQKPEASWGETAALEDLRGLRQAATDLLEAAAGHDAAALKAPQQQLTLAARRVATTATLLPEAESSGPAVAELQRQIAAIDAKLSELRLRFSEKASRTPGPVLEQPLQLEERFRLYENPQALLIDVRDARRLASQLQVGGHREWAFGYGQPNNLDALQVRRLILAARDLERGLEGSWEDISQVQGLWTDFHRQYDRLGYPGSTSVTRQLERVMERLSNFFEPSSPSHR